MTYKEPCLEIRANARGSNHHFLHHLHATPYGANAQRRGANAPVDEVGKNGRHNGSRR